MLFIHHNERHTDAKICLTVLKHASRQQGNESHREQSSVVIHVLLVLSFPRVHLVSIAGPDQVLCVVEQSGVQRVAVNQADQVLPVVLPAHNTARYYTQSI